MVFHPADYAILTAAGVAAAWGLFGGFSGALAFLAGTVAGAVAGRIGWSFAPAWLSSAWSQGLASAAVGLVVFALVRVVVRKLVHGMLAQPGDAIFGALTAGAAGFALSVGAVFLVGHFGLAEISSSLLSLLLLRIGGHVSG